MTTALFRPLARSTNAVSCPCGSERCPFPRQEEILLWRLDLPRLPVAPMLQFLTDAERTGEEEGRKYRRDFEFWLKSRAALRCILSACTGQPAPQIAITTGGGKKPELTDNQHGLHFNAARSKDYALIGLGRAPLGVDIEAVRPGFSWHTIATHWFHPREQALLAATPELRRIESFFQIWTHKEAYFKGVGTGLNRQAMTSRFTAPEGCSIWGLKGPPSQPWYLKVLDAPSGYKASLASMGEPRIVIDCTASFTFPPSQLLRQKGTLNNGGILACHNGEGMKKSSNPTM